VATLAGAHAERVTRVRELQTVKGRKEQGRFVFEGPTLLDEALRSGIAVEELYVAETVLAGNPTVRDLDAAGTPVFVVDERTLRKLSDLETPTGLIAITRQRLSDLETILRGKLTLVLADLNDPGNVGTLLRSAEAFGATGVVHGSLGVDPYHPKVVRGAMGAAFRVPLAVASAGAFAAAAKASGCMVVGLAARGSPLETVQPGEATALVVGHERRGLSSWMTQDIIFGSIAMREPVDSLNAAVAGSIGLYVLSKILSREY
jgi:RNA methyltransferase, TrmH family